MEATSIWRRCLHRMSTPFSTRPATTNPNRRRHQRRRQHLTAEGPTLPHTASFLIGQRRPAGVRPALRHVGWPGPLFPPPGTAPRGPGQPPAGWRRLPSAAPDCIVRTGHSRCPGPAATLTLNQRLPVRTKARDGHTSEAASIHDQTRQRCARVHSDATVVARVERDGLVRLEVRPGLGVDHQAVYGRVADDRRAAAPRCSARRQDKIRTFGLDRALLPNNPRPSDLGFLLWS
jgi:hypothetical protein